MKLLISAFIVLALSPLAHSAPVVNCQIFEIENGNFSRDPQKLLHARHSDITVLGRRHTFDYMPEGLIGTLLKKSGRPIIIAPDAPTSRPIRTVVVGWKETGECARALTTCRRSPARLDVLARRRDQLSWLSAWASEV